MAKIRDDEAMGAILNGEHKAFQALLEAGLSPNATTRWGKPLLQYAAEEGQGKIVELLIAAGADLNGREPQFGQTALMLAADEGRLEVVRTLLAAGADPHLKNNHDINALGDAASGGKRSVQVQIAELLLKAGVDPQGYPLAGASGDRGSPEMIKLLVKAGADPNVATFWGTPLMWAVNDKQADHVAALVAAGADPLIPVPKYGDKTPLDIAREKKLTKIVALLEAAVAGVMQPAARKQGAKPKPPTAADIPALWERIKTALKQHGPKVLKSLQRGATEAQFKKLEKTCGCKLPADFRAAYKLHNGQKPASQPLLPDEFTWGDFEFLTIDGILREWQSWKELIDIDEFHGKKSTPDKGIRSDWWHPGWIPFAANGGGDSICLDLAPAKSGIAGQVTTMNHDSPERLVLAKSLADYLGKLAEHWEQ